MDLDEMRAKWAEQDRLLQRSIRLNEHLFNTTYLNKTQTALRRWAFGLGVEVLMSFSILVALGNFLYDHRTQVQFALPALALDLFLIALMGSLIWQMIQALQMDYSRPVIVLQNQLEALRLWSLRSIQWVFLLSPLLWPLLLIVGLKGFLGLDAYQMFGVPYLLANLLFGVGFLLVALWLSRKYSSRMRRFPILQGLMRDLAGHNLNAATDFLKTLSDFENEK